MPGTLEPQKAQTLRPGDWRKRSPARTTRHHVDTAEIIDRLDITATEQRPPPTPPPPRQTSTIRKPRRPAALARCIQSINPINRWRSVASTYTSNMPAPGPGLTWGGRYGSTRSHTWLPGFHPATSNRTSTSQHRATDHPRRTEQHRATDHPRRTEHTSPVSLQQDRPFTDTTDQFHPFHYSHCVRNASGQAPPTGADQPPVSPHRVKIEPERRPEVQLQA